MVWLLFLMPNSIVIGVVYRFFEHNINYIVNDKFSYELVLNRVISGYTFIVVLYIRVFSHDFKVMQLYIIFISSFCVSASTVDFQEGVGVISSSWSQYFEVGTNLPSRVGNWLMFIVSSSWHFCA